MLSLLLLIRRRLTTPALAAALATTALPADAAHYDVVLLGGQSNADGRASASGLSRPLASAQPGVRFYYGATDRFPQRTLPRNLWQPLAPGAGADFGPEVGFGRAIEAARPDRSLAIVKHARGGSDLYSDWAPRGPDHAAFHATVASALATLANEGHTYRVRAMLWVQGETDVIRGRSATEYEADLAAFIEDLRGRYGTELPFFVAEASDGQTALGAAALATLRSAQLAISAADSRTFLVETDGFGMKADALHYDAVGQVQLGEAFASSYLAIVPEPTTLTSAGLVVAILPPPRATDCRSGRRRNTTGPTPGGPR